MASDPQVQIRQKFDEILAEAKKEAATQTAPLKKNDELERLTAEQQVLKYHNDLLGIKSEIDNFETIEYYCFAKNKMLLYKIFSARILCNERNEEQNIRKGFMLSEKYNQTSHQLLKAKKQIPPFTYKKYLANEDNVMLYELQEQPYGTTDEDYLKICSWQINKKVECTLLEFNLLRENFLISVADEIEFNHCIQKEIDQLENIYHYCNSWKADRLKRELGLLRGLNNIYLGEDFSAFYQEFCQALKGNRRHLMQKPLFFNQAIHAIKNRKITNPFIFFLSLLMYCRWLSDVLAGAEDIRSKNELSFSDLFNIGLKEGITLGKIAVGKLKEKFIDQKSNDKKYRKALKKEYNKQIKLLDKLDYPDYFSFLEQTQKLRNCFLNDCLYSINTDLPFDELKRAIVLNEILSFLDEELSLVDHNPLGLISHLLLEKTQMIEIICHLAPKTGQIKQLLETLARVSNHCHNERIPLCFIHKEINNSFSSIFKAAIEDYIQSIGRMNTNERGYFLVEQLRDIKHIERMCKIDNHEMNSYFQQIKHIDEDELEIVQDMQPYKIISLSELLDKKETKKTKPLSFGYRPGPRPYKPIVKAMFLRMNLVADDTTVDEYMEVVTAPDLSKVTKKVPLGIKLTVFRKFMELSKSWFKNFKAARIEQSGIFISLKEGPVTAKVIYNSKEILKEDNDLVEEIFKAKYNSSE